MVSKIVPPREIEDIVQETYVRICQIDNKEEIKSPRSFMFKTAKNLAYDHIKSAGVKWLDDTNDDAMLEQLLSSNHDDEMYRAAASNEAFADFCEAIRQLPLQCRKIFILKKVYGYSQREIAEQVNLSESTVEKHIATGMKRCTLFMRQRQHIPAENRQPVTQRGGGYE
ncbi:RNA polymerase sigma factor [Catenovulum sediminis]|uniref:RNA polymerase sigma factor n=1 Tax=Catenovulum sediminis TaxID=1740262 RepID=UPI001FE4F5FA|nr:RNA polymerase sigma factor [Catenovulum sediminis]